VDTPNPKIAIDTQGVCASTGLGRSTVLRLAYTGVIPSFTVGRRRLFLVRDIESWIDEQAAGVATATEAQS
jgi:excisionase family DNA binding protein